MARTGVNTLYIAVGGAGGGSIYFGGGPFIYQDLSTPLAVAGGGYSGGIAGFAASGGGGSFLAASATDRSLRSGIRSGDGIARIDAVASAVPEASTWSMLMTAFCIIGTMLRRRRFRTA